MKEKGKIIRAQNGTIEWVEASLVAQIVKNLPAIWDIWVRSLGWEDPLEKGMVPTPVCRMENVVHGVTKSQTQLSDFHSFTS